MFLYVKPYNHSMYVTFLTKIEIWNTIKHSLFSAMQVFSFPIIDDIIASLESRPNEN